MTVSSTTTNPMYSLLTDNSQNNPVSTLLGSNTVDSTSASDPSQLLFGSSGTQSSSLGTDMQNGTNSIAMMQIADKALSSLQSDAKELNSISTQLSNTSLSSDQQSQLQQQATTLTQNMQKTLDSATFNGQSVFGNYSTTIGGMALNTGVTAPDLSKLDVNNPQTITDFLKGISTDQSTIGSQIVQTSNSMINSINQSMFQAIDGSSDSTDSSGDMFDQSYISLQESMSSLNAQSLSSAHNTSAMQSSVSSLLG